MCQQCPPAPFFVFSPLRKDPSRPWPRRKKKIKPYIVVTNNEMITVSIDSRSTSISNFSRHSCELKSKISEKKTKNPWQDYTFVKGPHQNLPTQKGLRRYENPIIKEHRTYASPGREKALPWALKVGESRNLLPPSLSAGWRETGSMSPRRRVFPGSSKLAYAPYYFIIHFSG